MLKYLCLDSNNEKCIVTIDVPYSVDDIIEIKLDAVIIKEVRVIEVL